MHQNAKIGMLRFKNFPVAMPPEPPCSGGLQHSSPNPTPRHSGASLGASFVPPPMFVSRWRHCVDDVTKIFGVFLGSQFQ